MISSFISESNVLPWQIFILRRLFTWAGHVARLRRKEPDRITCRVLAYRSCQELDAHAFLTGGWQGHPGRYFVHNWEHQFHDCFKNVGLDWQDCAMNKPSWNKYFSMWCKSMMKSRTPRNIDKILERSSSRKRSIRDPSPLSKRLCPSSVS